jgi:putative membrane protein
MVYFLVKWLVNTVALLLVVKLIPGITVSDWQTAFIAGLVLGFVNSVIRPVLIVLTLPLNILSLGLFTLVINAFLFYSVAQFVPGLHIPGFLAALWGSLLFSIISWLLSALVAPQHVGFRFYRPGRPTRPGGRSYHDAIDVDGHSEDPT